MKNEYVIRDEAMTLPVLPKEQRIQLNNVDEAFEDGWRQALENLANLPAADVVKVRHGLWRISNWGFDYYCCSVCGYEHRYEGPFAYCPSCGAKMDGGQDG